MSELKTTPGPLIMSDAELIARLRRIDIDATRRAADRIEQLQAVLGEVSEALRLFVEEYDARDDHDGVEMMIAYANALEAAKAALAKARGETPESPNEH